MRTIACVAAAVLTLAPATVHAAAYTLNKDHTDVTFTINHLGFSMKHGWFNEVEGMLDIDPAKPAAAKVDVTIKATSINTNHGQRDKDISAPNMLDTAKFPTIHYVSTKVTPTGADTATVVGDLTLHGVTKPVTMMVKLNKQGPSPFGGTPTMGFTGKGMLKRSDFGINAMLPMIGDEVDFVIDTEFSGQK